MTVPRTNTNKRLSLVRQSLERHQEYLALVHAVAEVANESRDLDAVVAEVLDMVCESFDWPVGHALRVVTRTEAGTKAGAEAKLELNRDVEHWHFEDDAGFPSMRDLDFETLYGETLTTGAPQSYIGAAAVQRLATVRPHGINALFTTPIISGTEVVALLAFYGRESNEERLASTELPLSTISVTVGRVAERERVEQQRVELVRAEVGREAAELRASELRALAAELERAIQSRDSVLSVVSHDLRGPLNNIVLAMNLVEGGNEAQRGMAVAGVRRAVDRAQRLIHDLTEIGQMSSGILEISRRPISASALVRAVLEDIKPSAGEREVALVVDIDDELDPIFADRDRVIQVLDNLLRNAIKFGPRGGSLFVSTARRGDAVEFTVRDEGPGLDEHGRAHVFERFWQATDVRRRTKGSGLGLAIAKGIVERHEGIIGVDSQPGEGARFYFTIPFVR